MQKKELDNDWGLFQNHYILNNFLNTNYLIQHSDLLQKTQSLFNKDSSENVIEELKNLYNSVQLNEEERIDSTDIWLANIYASEQDYYIKKIPTEKLAKIMSFLDYIGINNKVNYGTSAAAPLNNKVTEKIFLDIVNEAKSYYAGSYDDYISDHNPEQIDTVSTYQSYDNVSKGKIKEQILSDKVGINVSHPVLSLQDLLNAFYYFEGSVKLDQIKKVDIVYGKSCIDIDNLMHIFPNLSYVGIVNSREISLTLSSENSYPRVKKVYLTKNRKQTIQEIKDIFPNAKISISSHW